MPTHPPQGLEEFSPPRAVKYGRDDQDVKIALVMLPPVRDGAKHERLQHRYAFLIEARKIPVHQT